MKLRQHCQAIFDAGIQAIDTKLALDRIFTERDFELDKYENIYVIGVGKVALSAATHLEKKLGDKITSGLVLDVQAGKLKHLDSIAGSHPFPDENNVKATTKIIEHVEKMSTNDLLMTIISGGGSALLCQPHAISCNELSLITKSLMAAGATIHELNTVRKHLSKVSGGQLAQMAHPADVVSLIFSDIPGDDLEYVASGPTFLDTTTAHDAQRILNKYDVLKKCMLPNCDLIETPKAPALFDHVKNILVVNNEIALEAMANEAKQLGYEPVIYNSELTGEAREVGALLSSLIRPGQALIAGGETTVTVTNPEGAGGRNFEVALGALSNLPENSLVASFASDGIDNCQYAGGFVDNHVTLDPTQALNTNNSLTFFEESKTFFKTGPTGVNVSDLILALRSKYSLTKS